MQQRDWQDRWDNGQTAFHLGAVHPALECHHTLFAAGASVLVPLAGKTVDLDALAGWGHHVVANEFVERAAREYFAERDITPEESRAGQGLCLRHGAITYRVDDFFALPGSGDLGAFDAVFDRAAMVAIDPAQRARYARCLHALTRPGSVILLLAFEIPECGVQGPPFSLRESEVRAAFAEGFSVEVLDAREEPAGARYQQAGVATWLERSYRIERQG